MSVLVYRNGSICHRCAFRARLTQLEAQRLRSTVSLRSAQSIGLEPGSRPCGRPQGEYAGPLLSLNRGPKSSGVGNRRDFGGIAVRKFFGREPAEKRGRELEEKRGPKPAEKSMGRTIHRRLTMGFRDALGARLRSMKEEAEQTPLIDQLVEDQREAGVRLNKGEEFEKLWKSFVTKILDAADAAEDPKKSVTDRDETRPQILNDLWNAFRLSGPYALDDRLKYAFHGHVTGSRFSNDVIKTQRAVADLRYPTEWYPATRRIQRKIHLHVGPTNSGKTYHALQRLERAEKGVYAGPLRLLAHEVYSRLNAKGKQCSLITGEERRAAPDSEGTLSDVVSCTVEMVPLNRTLDVAVIDEIQMIGNTERGWAWTQALMGVKAKEVHLCGEERTVPLVTAICASVGEEVIVHRYERLSPLKMAPRSLGGDLSQLRKGDCVVSFSIMGIHALRQQIERATGKKVAIVYGSLPPETRAQQARLFNDPNNDYDFLVASDAVGMGLNLAIKRIIFETTSKFDGSKRRTLSVADIKQIAGRAGRFRVALQDKDTPASAQSLAAAKGDTSEPTVDPQEESVGLVTTLESFDYPIVRTAMSSNPEPIVSAGIFPPGPVLHRFASYFPVGTPFSYILTRLHDMSQLYRRFHLCGLLDQLWIADAIEPVQGLTIQDRNILCSAPVNTSDRSLWKDLLPAYARCIAEQSGGGIADIKELPLELLEAEISASREYLRALEQLHKGIVAYLWLSYRFAGIFNTRSLAFHVKGLVEEKIELVLSKFSFSESSRKKIARNREKEVLRELGVDPEAKTSGPIDGETAGTEEPATKSSSKDDELDADDGSRLQAELANSRASVEDEPSPDLLREGSSEARGRARVLEGQKIITNGGDRFSGEESTPFDEPLDNGHESFELGYTNMQGSLPSKIHLGMTTKSGNKET